MTTTDALPGRHPAPTLGGIVFDDPGFDAQLLRALDAVAAGGADIGECLITARSITPGDRDDWHTQWTALGDRVFAVAERSASAGRTVSARQAYLRAATYYRTSSIFLYRPPLHDGLVDAYRRQRDAFQRAARLLPCSFEIARIPYQDTTLEAYFFTPSGPGPFPVVFVGGGYDGTKEESYLSGGHAALERGYAVFVMDGPGQGGALIEQGLVFRPDWETVVTPAVDWLTARPDVNARQIAMLGRSWGGYLAPRAATREHRLAAVIADAAQYAPGPRAVSMLPPEYRDQVQPGDLADMNAELEQRMQAVPALRFTLERGMLTHGCRTPLDYLRSGGPYTIADQVADISCPVLVCEAENDVRGGDAKPLFDALTGPKDYLLFTNAEGAGEHCEAGAPAVFAQRAYDWLDRVLVR